MLYPGHVHHVAAYVRALKQRNRLLSAGDDVRLKGADERQMESWEETLAQEGARLLWNRVRYCRTGLSQQK